MSSQSFMSFPHECWGPVLRLYFKSLHEFLLLCRRRASADVPRNRSERGGFSRMPADGQKPAALTCDPGMTPLPA